MVSFTCILSRKFSKINFKNLDLAKFPLVRLVDEKGNFSDKPIKASDILEKMNSSYDLIVVNEQATPYPIAKLVLRQNFDPEKDKSSRLRKVSRPDLKEVRLGTTISENDLHTKIKSALKLIDSGHHVKFSIEPKGKAASMLGAKDNICQKVLGELKKATEIDVLKKPCLISNMLCFEVAKKNLN